MSGSGIWKIERGRDPKISLALKIAMHYEKKISEIWPDLEQAIAATT